MVERPNAIGRNALGDRATWTARRTPDKVAFVVAETGKKVTFEAFNDRANRAANAFRAAGLDPGDRVGFVTGNSERMLAAEFGALKAGLVPALNNTQLDVDTMSYQLETADAEAVVVDAARYPTVEPYVDEAGVETVVSIEWDRNAEAGVPFESFIEDQPATDPSVDLDGDDPALIMYTSGTTSRPKAVLHTHDSYAYNTANVSLKYRLATEDVVATVHPLFHIIETYLRGAFELSATNVIFREFHPEAFMEAVETHDITTFYLLSSLYRRLESETDLDAYDTSSVRRCGYGMPMEMTLRERIAEAFDADLQLAMGQTEAGILMFLDPAWQFEKAGNYIGRPGPYGDAAIMDDDGNLLSAGELGELVFRSPAVMDRYLANESKTEEVWRDGWHRTGDIARIDEDGLFVLVDRKKDIVKTGGENVSTTKVQNVVGDHPDVEAVAIVGLPHDTWTEAVTAFVIPADGADVTEDDIIDFSRDRLAGFEVPKAVEFVEDLPETATGKIRKVEIREAYADKFQ